MASAALNLRARQQAALERMLRLDGGQWKVLVYDAFCRDLISPLLTVGRLRESGVTLHMLLDSAREAIPDVPAVYLMQPSADNLRVFAEDCRKQLYDQVYLNLCSPLPQQQLEQLARQLVELNCVNVVAKVLDQFLGFVALEPRLFTLNLPRSFVRYNQPGLPDAQVERCMDEVAGGLLAAVTTLGAVPIVRCPAGGPAEMVARKTVALLQDLLERQPQLFQGGGSAASALEQRPLLLIVDRSVDLAAPLMHTDGYQTLVDDLLELGLNRVKVPAADGADAQGRPVPSAEPPKVLTLDKESDAFWGEHAGSAFAAAVEVHARELKQVQEQEKAIKQQTGRSELGGGGAEGGSSALLDTVSSLPALLEKKALLQRHMSILSAVMAVVSKRQVYRFVQPETQVVFSKYIDKASVLELAADPALLLRDKLRLLALYMLCTSPPQQEADEVEAAVVASSAQEQLEPHKRDELLRFLKYVKKVLALSRFGGAPAAAAHAAPAAASVAGWDLAALTRSAIQNASRQVKSIVGEAKLLAAVRLMELCVRDTTGAPAQQQEQDAAAALYLDPRVRGNGCEVPPSSRSRAAFTRGVLFVVGGGCLHEYHNLQDLAAGKQQTTGATAVLRMGQASDPAGTRAQFIYGASELLTADKFAEQLAACEKA